MTLQEILLITKPMDRIKRIDASWLTKYIIVCDKSEMLYLVSHTNIAGMVSKPYIPILCDLLSTDWDFMR